MMAQPVVGDAKTTSVEKLQDSWCMVMGLVKFPLFSFSSVVKKTYRYND